MLSRTKEGGREKKTPETTSVQVEGESGGGRTDGSCYCFFVEEEMVVYVWGNDCPRKASLSSARKATLFSVFLALSSLPEVSFTVNE